jgi:acetyl-CoA carboxylase/biotin carboxylase 1
MYTPIPWLSQVDGESHVLHTEEEALGTRLVMDTLSCLIAKEADPSRLVAVSPGKLVRYLVANGDHVEQNQAYAELEVMKMVMPVVAPAAGMITFLIPEGSSMSAGDLMARLELDDPTKVSICGSPACESCLCIIQATWTHHGVGLAVYACYIRLG